MMSVDVTATVEPEDVLSELDIGDLIDFYGKDVFLDEIGEDYCVHYFEIEKDDTSR
jgi:hypothetical protein